MTAEKLETKRLRILSQTEHKLGTMYAAHEGNLYSIVGDGYILRVCQGAQCDWIVELSYGDEWESIGTYESQYEAIGAMVCKAHSLNT